MAEGTRTQLRRHGDIFGRLPGGYYVAKGRSDDTMNLGGIKARSYLTTLAQSTRPQWAKMFNADMQDTLLLV